MKKLRLVEKEVVIDYMFDTAFQQDFYESIIILITSRWQYLNGLIVITCRESMIGSLMRLWLHENPND
jgi:hypothetical protein